MGLEVVKVLGELAIFDQKSLNSCRDMLLHQEGY